MRRRQACRPAPDGGEGRRSSAAEQGSGRERIAPNLDAGSNPAAVPLYWSPDQVAAKLQLSRQTVMALVQRRELEAIRVPGRHGAERRCSWRISESSLEEFLARNRFSVAPVARMPWEGAK